MTLLQEEVPFLTRARLHSLLEGTSFAHASQDIKAEIADCNICQGFPFYKMLGNVPNWFFTHVGLFRQGIHSLIFENASPPTELSVEKG